jgi:hypothetical protein
MQLYKRGAKSIVLGGITYQADGNGVVDVPDNKVDSSVWGKGFVIAGPVLAAIEADRLKEEAAAAKPVSTTSKTAPPATA